MERLGSVCPVHRAAELEWGYGESGRNREKTGSEVDEIFSLIEEGNFL